MNNNMNKIGRLPMVPRYVTAPNYHLLLGGLSLRVRRKGKTGIAIRSVTRVDCIVDVVNRECSQSEAL